MQIQQLQKRIAMLEEIMIITGLKSQKDFLSEQRGCKNIHFHETMDLQARLHMKSCSFQTHI